ncbi:salutaridine reductase, partial [Quercus suber]
SIKSLANFIQEKFSRLDILANNAGASGVVVDEEGLKALNIDPSSWLSGQAYNLIELHGVIKKNYEKAEECLNTNYHGVRRVTEALLSQLQLSPVEARMVNVSSLRSELKVKGGGIGGGTSGGIIAVGGIIGGIIVFNVHKLCQQILYGIIKISSFQGRDLPENQTVLLSKSTSFLS